ncbi:MAG: FkbM family methyltransferase [bacterium]|nr:FkbM family methyltransferase [bacterium]
MPNPFKKAVALIKKLPVIPFRGQLREFYKKYIRQKIYENRKVVTEIEGIKYELDLSTYAGIEAYYGNWEPAIVKIIKKYVKPGMTVMDIGASVGLHTFRMKKMVGPDGKVLAFDQKGSAIKALKKTARLNNLPVVINNVVLSDVNEGKEIKLDTYAKSKNISRLDFILMDIDGGEYRVFKGGLEALKKFKPIIMFEMHPSHLGQEGTRKLIDLLDDCDYSFFESSNLKQYSDNQSFTEDALTKKTIHILCK